MSPTQERKLLNELIKKLDPQGNGVLGSRLFLPALWVCLVVAFTLMFQLANRGLLSEPVLLVVAALIGTLVGWVLFYVTALKQWPVLRQHIDRASIEKRLQELET
jgi:hypothetical protein